VATLIATADRCGARRGSMIKNWTREITLAIQARSGASPTLFVCISVAAAAALTAFAFLCIAGYGWFAIQFGSIFAALLMTAIFALVAVIAAAIGRTAQQRARERAILERAARARAGSGLLDPKLLTLAVQAGRSVGWQRVVPVALFGFVAAQWLREYREHRRAR
jgi:hypothetical protein